MKRIMSETVQFGGGHFTKGEEVFARRIGKTSCYILSKRKSQPVGPTVAADRLKQIAELVED